MTYPQGRAIGKIVDPDCLRDDNLTPAVEAVAISPDRTKVASLLAASKTIRIWDVKTCRETGHFDLELDSPSLTFTADSKNLIAGGLQKLMMVDLAAKTIKLLLPGNNRFDGRRFALSPDGKVLAVSGYESVFLLEMATGKVTEVDKRAVLDGVITALAWDPIKPRLAVSRLNHGYQRGPIELLDTGNFEIVRVPDHNFQTESLAVSPSGKQLAVGCDHGLVLVWDITAPKPVLIKTCITHDWNVKAIAFADETWLTILSNNQHFSEFDLKRDGSFLLLPPE